MSVVLRAKTVAGMSTPHEDRGRSHVMESLMLALVKKCRFFIYMSTDKQAVQGLGFKVQVPCRIHQIIVPQGFEVVATAKKLNSKLPRGSKLSLMVSRNHSKLHPNLSKGSSDVYFAASFQAM